ncbi:MAG TPA: hypothetical protein VG942_19005 [Hyphomonadaceae bacterium]|nr:hypothetical protein [Hyphomonadaceae bacterium]
MAQTQSDQPEAGDSNAKLNREDARQGQNVRGMVWVLGIGTLLVVAAYAVMLALGHKPNSLINEQHIAASQATQSDGSVTRPQGDPAPTPVPETAGSPG